MSEIIQLLKDSGAIKFGEFTLTSGEKSKYYIDVKLAATKPWVLSQICKSIEEAIDNLPKEPDYIACMELGGVPLGVLVSYGESLPLIIVRKAEKQHGTRGRFVGDFEKGKTAVLVEDVTTTGGSSLSAVKALRDAGLLVDTVITVVDRQQRSGSSMAVAGIRLIALTTAKEILEAQQ
jgi:orotate phosphoribosyltransferase